MTETTVQELRRLAELLGELKFRFPSKFCGTTQLRDTVVARLKENLSARAEDLDAPLVAVIAGSTGVGKSTLLNSFTQHYTVTSAKRPTTLTPVLVHHPDDELWFAGERILSGFKKIRLLEDDTFDQETEFAQSQINDTQTDSARPQLILRSSKRIHKGICLIDCPDLDSYIQSNRDVASHLLEIADLWIFVTTAERYHDRSGLELLIKAASRKAMIGIVLNRVTTGSLLDTKADLIQELGEVGLDQAPIFAILEGSLDDGELLEDDISSLRKWLDSLAGDALMRTAAARQIFFGSLKEIWDQIEHILHTYRQQNELRNEYLELLNEVEKSELSKLDDFWFSGEILAGVPTGLLIELAEYYIQSINQEDAWMRWRLGRKRVWSSQTLTAQPVIDSTNSALQSAYLIGIENLEAAICLAWEKHPDTKVLLEQNPLKHSDIDAVSKEILSWWDCISRIRGNLDATKQCKISEVGENAFGLIVLFQALHPYKELPEQIRQLGDLLCSREDCNQISKQLRSEILSRLETRITERVNELRAALPDLKDLDKQADEIQKLVDKLSGGDLFVDAK